MWRSGSNFSNLDQVLVFLIQVRGREGGRELRRREGLGGKE